MDMPARAIPPQTCHTVDHTALSPSIPYCQSVLDHVQLVKYDIVYGVCESHVFHRAISQNRGKSLSYSGSRANGEIPQFGSLEIDFDSLVLVFGIASDNCQCLYLFIVCFFVFQNLISHVGCCGLF